MPRFIAYTKSTVGVMRHAKSATGLPSLSKLLVHKESMVRIRSRHTSVIHETGSAPLVMFDTNVNKLCTGISACDIITSIGKDPADFFPAELNTMVGKKILFKVLFTQHNVNSNSHVYTCKSVSDDYELIAHFKSMILSENEVIYPNKSYVLLLF